MGERFDAIVIGAGLGGLAAAATLAGRGHSVLVLEQHTQPGGYAQRFERGPYRFDVSLHALSRLAPGGGVDHLYRDLGIGDRLRLRRLDPLYQLRLPDRDVVAHADLFRYEAELIGHFPAAAMGIRSYLDEVLAVYHDLRRIEEDRAAGRAPAPAEYPVWFPALARASGETWEQMMARHLGDARARTALAGLWCYVGLPPSRCSALVGAGLIGGYHEHGGWYPEGGAGALAGALTRVLGERGGVVRLGQEAVSLDVRGESVAAVTTGDGQRLEADLFVSNASAPATVLQLLGRGHVPGEYADRVASRAASFTTFVVYLGLRRDVFGEQGLPHELILAPSYDSTESWNAAQRGDWGKAALLVTDYTRSDPGCAPPGHAVVTVTTVAGWDYADTWGTGGDLAGYHDSPSYRRIKEQTAQALIARADEAAPGLAGAVERWEAATPLTNFHYTRNPRGAIEGYENSPANAGRARLPHDTPLRNLFLAGAWAGSGGMSNVISSGVAAARLAMERAPARA